MIKRKKFIWKKQYNFYCNHKDYKKYWFKVKAIIHLSSNICIVELRRIIMIHLSLYELPRPAFIFLSLLVQIILCYIRSFESLNNGSIPFTSYFHYILPRYLIDNIEDGENSDRTKMNRETKTVDEVAKDNNQRVQIRRRRLKFPRVTSFSPHIFVIYYRKFPLSMIFNVAICLAMVPRWLYR